jgi:hypothetical protein
MKRKPYSEDFSDLEVTIHGCTFEINGNVAFDVKYDDGEGYFDFDVPDINLTAVLVPSGDPQTDSKFIRFFWETGRAVIQDEVENWLQLYHSSLLEDEANPDEIYDNEKQG